MKKSKFLKKSLAMLLALMLVVAMIPLSASAAEPSIAKVLVNETKASVSGTTYSAEIVDPGNGAVTIKVELANKVGSVAHYTTAGQLETNDATEANGVWSFNMTASEKAAKSAQFVVVDEDNQQKTTYTVTYTTVDANTDTAVKSIHLQKAVEGVEYGEVVLEGDTYILTAPYGYTIGSGVVKVTPAASTSSVKLGNGTNVTQNIDGSYDVPVTAYDTKVAFSVVAQSGDVKNYYVKVTEPKPFASFSIAGERRDAKISRVTEEDPINFAVSATAPQVEVYLPYGETVGANGSYMFTPTFETNYDVTVKAVKTTDASEVELESGKAYDLKDFATSWTTTTEGDRVVDTTVNLKVYYNNGSTPEEEDWTLTFDALAAGQDPVPAIKALTVDNYQATIDGDKISISLPESTRKTTQAIDLVVSENVQVEVVNVAGSTKTAASDAGLTLTPVKLTANEYTLRVKAAAKEFDSTATDPDVKDYYLTITTAEVQAPKMTAAYLQSADGTEKITATIDTNTIKFSGIPYRYDNVADMQADGWKLFWTASSGCTVTSNGNPITQTGKVVNSSWGYLPTPNAGGGTVRFEDAKAAQTIVVSNGTSSQEYTVIFDSADASHASTLSSMKLAKSTVTNYDNLSDVNTLDLTVSGYTVKGDVWYVDWTDFTNGAVVVTTLPAGAKLYYVAEDGSKTLTALDEINENDKTVGAKLPADTGDYDYGKDFVNSPTNPNGKKPLKLVVASEALTDVIGTTVTTYTQLDTKTYSGLFTSYDLTLTQKEPRNDNTITAFSVLDAYTGNVAKATVKGDAIDLTLPYYFVDGNRKSANNLYVDYTINAGGATVTSGAVSGTYTDTLNALVYDLDGNLDTTASLKLTWDGKTLKATNSINYIKVTAEDGTTRENPYTLTVTIADPEETAVLNSVSINGYTGTPDAQGNVTINLPYGTEVTKLNPKFNVSTNAYVVVGDKSQIAQGGTNMVDADSTYNFLNPRTFTVVSEDGKATNTYTVTVGVSDQFTDVNPDDWFYDNVMDAAANGYVSGEGNGIFNPYGATTRAAFASMIANAMGYEAGGTVESRFTDVDVNNWAAGAIAFCYDNGYISGYDDGTFQPNKAITRQEAAAILNNTFGLEDSTTDELFADDGSIASWAKAHVYAAKAAGLMKGDVDGNFRPNDTIIRAESASIMMNANRAGLID